MPTDPEALVATLQLLLGDVSDDEKRALFYEAFPSSFIILRGDAKALQNWLSEADSQINEIHGKADGSSPLGIIAVGQRKHRPHRRPARAPP
jgi:hypothetical protein